MKNFALANLAAVQFPLCSNRPAWTSIYNRWEILACNVIYLARNPIQSAQPAATANAIKGN